jgi:hypothetical protein
MLNRLSQLAEHAATSASRRQFLGRLGRGALAAAAASGGLLALPAIANAGRRQRICGTNSGSWCLNHSVGDPCMNGGKCTVIKGTTDTCYCRDPGNPGRG